MFQMVGTLVEVLHVDQTLGRFARRHLAKSRGVSRSAPAHLDGASSARWFDGWRPEVESRIQNSGGASEVARPRTWLLRLGWRRHGLVDPSEVPGEAV